MVLLSLVSHVAEAPSSQQLEARSFIDMYALADAALAPSLPIIKKERKK